MPVPIVGELNPISQFCFAMEVRVLAKPTLGDMNESRVVKEKGEVLDGVTPSWYVRLGHTCRCEQGY